MVQQQHNSSSWWLWGGTPNRDLWAFVSVWSVDMFLTHTSCPLHVPLGHNNWSGVLFLFVWVLYSPLVNTTDTIHPSLPGATGLYALCEANSHYQVRAGGQGPFPPTNGTTHSLHCSCSLSCLHQEYSLTLQLPYFFFYYSIFLDIFAFKQGLKCLWRKVML